MTKIFLTYIFLGLVSLSQVYSQFGTLTLISQDLSAIQPLSSQVIYTIELKYDAISTSGPDNVDPATIDLTVIPPNGIQLISGPTLSADLCTITFDFMPLIDPFQILVCADDASPFTQGSKALYRTGELSVGACPQNLALNNITIPDDQYAANQTIESNGIVLLSGDVSFQAGICVALNEGFQVLPTGKFEAFIAPGCN